MTKETNGTGHYNGGNGIPVDPEVLAFLPDPNTFKDMDGVWDGGARPAILAMDEGPSYDPIPRVHDSEPVSPEPAEPEPADLPAASHANLVTYPLPRPDRKTVTKSPVPTDPFAVIGRLVDEHKDVVFQLPAEVAKLEQLEEAAKEQREVVFGIRDSINRLTETATDYTVYTLDPGNLRTIGTANVAFGSSEARAMAYKHVIANMIHGGGFADVLPLLASVDAKKDLDAPTMAAINETARAVIGSTEVLLQLRLALAAEDDELDTTYAIHFSAANPETASDVNTVGIEVRALKDARFGFGSQVSANILDMYKEHLIIDDATVLQELATVYENKYDGVMEPSMILLTDDDSAPAYGNQRTGMFKRTDTIPKLPIRVVPWDAVICDEDEAVKFVDGIVSGSNKMTPDEHVYIAPETAVMAALHALIDHARDASDASVRARRADSLLRGAAMDLHTKKIWIKAEPPADAATNAPTEESLEEIIELPLPHIRRVHQEVQLYTVGRVHDLLVNNPRARVSEIDTTGAINIQAQERTSRLRERMTRRSKKAATEIVGQEVVLQEIIREVIIGNEDFGVPTMEIYYPSSAFGDSTTTKDEERRTFAAITSIMAETGDRIITTAQSAHLTGDDRSRISEIGTAFMVTSKNRTEDYEKLVASKAVTETARDFANELYGSGIPRE